MVDVETYLEESNAIEDVHTERALSDSFNAWNYLRQQSELTHDALQTAHEHILIVFDVSHYRWVAHPVRRLSGKQSHQTL
jgi:hypothetical protein